MSCCDGCKTTGGSCNSSLAAVPVGELEEANGNAKKKEPGFFDPLAKAIAGVGERAATCIVCGAAPLAFGTAGAVIAATLPSGEVSRGRRAVYAALGTVGGVTLGLGALALWRHLKDGST